jgi:hypothetical protein
LPSGLAKRFSGAGIEKERRVEVRIRVRLKTVLL